MTLPRLTAALLACCLVTGCFPSADEQARPQTGHDGGAPVATAAPLPQLSEAPWEPTTITTDALKAKIDGNEPMVIYDVRAFESWEAEHITGSKSLPWGKLEDEKKRLPRDKPMVLYCA